MIRRFRLLLYEKLHVCTAIWEINIHLCLEQTIAARRRFFPQTTFALKRVLKGYVTNLQYPGEIKPLRGRFSEAPQGAKYEETEGETTTTST